METTDPKVINFAQARARRAKAIDSYTVPPTWQADIQHCCAYARLLKAEHTHERALIDFELIRDYDNCAWWDAPEDIRARVDANNLLWSTYIALLVHVAELPAETRQQATMKRGTIGRLWLKPNGTSGHFAKMRAGCLADDHLFPPSLRLAKLKGAVRVS